MSISWLVVSILVLPLLSISAQVVRMKSGSLRGFRNTSRSGKEYFGFLGVPYAAPPVNELRFQEPVPPPSWEGERDATKMGHLCPQASLSLDKNIMGNEDCLFLNVYSPKLDSNAKLPVMVYIHGGAFKMGSANFFKGNFFMDEDVVLVVINYRLGVLGFMTFGDEVIPGNLGLKDQISALRWVQENIGYFGGDPKAVTIFGCSAGGASVDFHVLSPLSKGLFRSAIIQSGTSTCPWAITPHNLAKQRAETVSTLLGCPSRPSAEAVACLREISTELLVRNGEKFEEWPSSPQVFFSPVIDAYLGNKSFLPDHPLQLSPHKVNVMLGFNAHEGNLAANQVCANNFKLARELEADVTRKLPIWAMLLDHVENKDKKKISKDIMEFYLKGEKINEKNVGTGFEMINKDFLFAHGSVKTALHYFKQVPVYFYLNDVEVPRDDMLDIIFGKCAYTKGASHGDENYLLFNDIASEYKGYTSTMSEADQTNSRRFINLWTTFAAKGIPSEKWSPVKSNSIEYLHITKDDMVMEKDLYTDRLKFIDSLPILVNKYKLS